MYVLTVDQRKSRTREDLVGPVLDELNKDALRPLVLPFDRTAGDEMQSLIDDASVTLSIAMELAVSGQWSVGIGIGEVRKPLPSITRAASGEAFERARAAVTAAKNASGNIAVSGQSPMAAQAEALLQLLVSVARKRSAMSVEAGILSDQGLTQQQIARQLGISQQAVSSRLQSGLWQESRRVRAVAESLLEGADL
ncbi:winged helix-turn-helix transcriptional regulator [Arthrobacter sp. SF27]|nr:winged helix-turn-helix transcriptional regulator [Arthrobacter sp. SF27]